MPNLGISMGSRVVKDRLESRIGDIAEIITQFRWRNQGFIVAPLSGKCAPLCDMMIADRTGKSVVVEVKATTTSVFTIGKLPRTCHRVYVFVHFLEKDKLKMKEKDPGKYDCYILTSQETKSVWKPSLGRNAKGGVRLSDIRKFKDQWSKPFDKNSRKSCIRQICGKKMSEIRPKYFTKSGKLRYGKTMSSYVKRAWREAKKEHANIAKHN